jgi:hypothetical protein
MRCPQSLNEQRIARCNGELFRGNGTWPSWGAFSALEPKFEPFDWSNITRWDLCLGGFTDPYQGEFIDRLQRLFFPAPAPPIRLFDNYSDRQWPLHMTKVAPFVDDDVTYANAEQLILALGPAEYPVAFEIFGIGQRGSQRHESDGHIEIRFATSDGDLPLLEAQLHSFFPRSAVVSHQYGEEDEDLDWDERLTGGEDRQDPLFVVPLYLDKPYCFPIRCYPRFETDPLRTAIAVMDELQPGEWALLQVLFSRAQHPWAENLRRACEDPYAKGDLILPGLDRRLLNQKLELPLYAVTVTLAANRQRTLNRLGALLHPFESPHNRLALRDKAAWARQWTDSPFPELRHWRDALRERETLSPGILLSVAELTGLVHLPHSDLPAERLVRVKSQTRQPPKPVLNASQVVIGTNVHRGQSRQVAIPPDLRSRHCYIAGASGTGKSTLLLNMILQDIGAGHGVGVLDPHGDLIKTVLRYIPKERLDDVVLFDASDTNYPFALNILDARDEAERERIVAETIMALERYFPASWGPRLERILQYTIRTVLHAIPGATLADVEQMLTDTDYREKVLAKTSDPRMLQFWMTQFKFLPKNACDPVLNKLSVFLLDRNVRNVICQRRSAIDFDAILNQGKILLANLSTGLLTEKVAGTLGSFLVTKIVNAAFRRAGMPESQRRPWYLYVDEFQNFMNVSVGFERILAESRKYKLTLAGLVTQYVGQVSASVRQAILGNVGSLIIFRLGIEDAQTVAKELGVFGAQDVLNLELGQAIVRAGGSSAAFNLQTYPELPPPHDDPTERICAMSRKRYANPRSQVEAELQEMMAVAERLEASVDFNREMEDPDESDLVS